MPQLADPSPSAGIDPFDPEYCRSVIERPSGADLRSLVPEPNHRGGAHPSRWSGHPGREPQRQCLSARRDLPRRRVLAPRQNEAGGEVPHRLRGGAVVRLVDAPLRPGQLLAAGRRGGHDVRQLRAADPAGRSNSLLPRRGSRHRQGVQSPLPAAAIQDQLRAARRPASGSGSPGPHHQRGVDPPLRVHLPGPRPPDAGRLSGALPSAADRALGDHIPVDVVHGLSRPPDLRGRGADRRPGLVRDEGITELDQPDRAQLRRVAKRIRRQMQAELDALVAIHGRRPWHLRDPLPALTSGQGAARDGSSPGAGLSPSFGKIGTAGDRRPGTGSTPCCGTGTWSGSTCRSVGQSSRSRAPSGSRPAATAG